MSDRVIHELLGQLAKAEVGFGKSVVEAQDLGYLIDCVASGKVTGLSSLFPACRSF